MSAANRQLDVQTFLLRLTSSRQPFHQCFLVQQAFSGPTLSLSAGGRLSKLDQAIVQKDSDL